MTLLERVKAALRRNVEIKQIAAVFGISEHLVIKAKEAMEQEKAIEKDFDEVGEKTKCNCRGMFHDTQCPLRIN